MTHHGARNRIDRPPRRGLLVAAVLAVLIAVLLWAPAAAAQDQASPDQGSAAETSPVEADSSLAVIGKHLFRSFCASCHGAVAKGDGSIAEMLRRPPADLTVLQAENGGDFPYQRTMAVIDGRVRVDGHGTAEMPAWGDAFGEISESDQEVQEKISQLVHYIWSIQEAKDAE